MYTAATPTFKIPPTLSNICQDHMTERYKKNVLLNVRSVVILPVNKGKKFMGQFYPSILCSLGVLQLSGEKKLRSSASEAKSIPTIEQGISPWHYLKVSYTLVLLINNTILHL